jgi:hypothetical protein
MVSLLGAGTMTISYTYLFEAKGLQRYIFASGKLRDAVGASDLLVRIASYPPADGTKSNDLVAAVAHRCSVPDEAFSRRGGGAFCVSFASRKDRDRFRALWRLTIAAALPGLEFSDAAVQGDSEAAAIDAAYAGLSAVRENAAASVLPLGGPATKFVPRTGRAELHISDGLRQTWNLKEPEDRQLDQALVIARRRGKEVLPPKIHGSETGPASVVLERYDALAARVLPEEFTRNPSQPADGGPPLLLPRNLTDDEVDSVHNPLFPFRGERNLAVVHADVSGLGQLFREQARGKSTRQRQTLSLRIEQVVLGAVRAAVRTAIDAGGAVEQVYDVDWGAPPQWRAHKSWPAETHTKPGTPGTVTARIAAFRPLVAGGDDVTFLVRSDLALDFAKALLEGIEAKAIEAEKQFGEKLPLSACAGVALVKASTPFLFAHDLAEALCKNAKEAAKSLKRNADGSPGEPPFASALTFHSPIGTLGESYERVVLKQELTATDVMLTGGPYGVGTPSGGGKAVQPALDGFLEFVEALDAHKGLGALRELRAILVDRGRHAAEEAWRRWWQVQKERGANLDLLAAALRSIDVAHPETKFLAPRASASADEPTCRTALFDALTVRALRRDSHATQPAMTAAAATEAAP